MRRSLHVGSVLLPLTMLAAPASAQETTVRDPESLLTVRPAPQEIPLPETPTVQQDVDVPPVEAALDFIFERVRVVGATAIEESVITAPFAAMCRRVALGDRRRSASRHRDRTCR